MLFLAVNADGATALVVALVTAAVSTWTALQQRRAKEAARSAKVQAETTAKIAEVRADETRTALAAWEKVFSAQQSHAETLRQEVGRMHELHMECERGRSSDRATQLENVRRIAELDVRVQILSAAGPKAVA